MWDLGAWICQYVPDFLHAAVSSVGSGWIDLARSSAGKQNARTCAGVWIRPLPSPLHTPSIGMCAMYIVMRRGAHGRAYACTGVCMGLASQQAASEAR